jgi:hypothetical protein
MMGEALANTNRKAYAIQTGHWFNSAKFWTSNTKRMGFAKQLEHEIQFYWEYKDGKKAIRISFHKESRQF